MKSPSARAVIPLPFCRYLSLRGAKRAVFRIKGLNTRSGNPADPSHFTRPAPAARLPEKSLESRETGVIAVRDVLLVLKILIAAEEAEFRSNPAERSSCHCAEWPEMSYGLIIGRKTELRAQFPNVP